MKDFEKASTTQLWQAIEHNARLAQEHLNWVEYLDSIRVLCALIDERVETFQRRMRTDQLLREHRGEFGLRGDDGVVGAQRAACSEGKATSRGRGETRVVS